MRWIGERLRDAVAAKGLTQEAISSAAGVSRQTFAEWIKGQTPRGNHLLSLCRILDADPASFFENDAAAVVPAHRTRRTAKRTSERDTLAADLATEYLPLFDGVPVPPLLMACRVACKPAAGALADEVRSIAGVSDSSQPLDYEHVFRLLDRLRVCAVFRRFPDDLKDYAFYTRLGDHRTVFVNSQTNVLDLIYPLLHEAVHAVRDVGTMAPVEYSNSDEAFCEQVASLAQFPAGYLDRVHSQVKGRIPAIQVNTLKAIATEKHHVIYGLVKAIGEHGGRLDLNIRAIHGADANLRKRFPTVETCLLASTAEEYVSNLQGLSPYFVRVLRSKAENITLRTLSSLLDLSSVQDAKEIRHTLREPDAHACAM